MELDVGRLEDARIDQELIVMNAKATYINAKENLTVIVKNQADSDISKAELDLKFAKEDLIQYKQGVFPNLLSAAKSNIAIAQEELTRARETLKWSERLYTDKYISVSELEADRLAEHHKAVNLELAKNNLKLLQSFTF